MKNIFLVIILIFFSCSKDDSNNIKTTLPIITYVDSKEIILDNSNFELTGLRDGFVDIILFLKSLSIDNFLISLLSNNVIKREHKAFNKDLVHRLILNSNDVIINDGINSYKHYNITLVYKDSTNIQFTAFVKDTLDNFVYYPTGENLVRSGHPSKILTYKATGQEKPYYNETRNSNYGLKRWQILLDGLPIKADYKEPTDKNATQYQLKHQN